MISVTTDKTMAEVIEANSYKAGSLIIVCVPNEDANSVSRENVTKSGIILLGADTLPNYENPAVTANQKTRYCRPAKLVQEYTIDKERYTTNFMEGDLLEIKGRAFDLTDGIIKCSDGYVVPLLPQKIACIHRNGDVVAFGRAVILEPVKQERGLIIIPGQAEHEQGAGIILSIGDGCEDGMAVGETALFSSTPYPINVDGKLYWEMDTQFVWGVQ